MVVTKAGCKADHSAVCQARPTGHWNSDYGNCIEMHLCPAMIKHCKACFKMDFFDNTKDYGIWNEINCADCFKDYKKVGGRCVKETETIECPAAKVGCKRCFPTDDSTERTEANTRCFECHEGFEFEEDQGKCHVKKPDENKPEEPKKDDGEFKFVDCPATVTGCELCVQEIFTTEVAPTAASTTATATTAATANTAATTSATPTFTYGAIKCESCEPGMIRTP
jgi:hypothetical protein